MTPQRPTRAANLLSLLVPLAALLLLIAIAQPWGDYPTTDDWIYARIARRFAETGKFVFDHDAGAAFIGQGALAAPVIRLLGFSHLHLRLLTIALSFLILYLLWRLLTYARVRPMLKAFALLLVVWNPIFGAVTMSFLTDIYGYTVALVGAVVWFRGRARHAADDNDSALVPWSASVLTGLILGASFWIRQYCVVMYPALLGATAFEAWRTGGARRLRASVPRIVAGCLAFAAVILAYFLFARYQAVIPMSDFKSRLHRIWPILPAVPFVEAGIFLTYMTAFFLPILLLFPVRQAGRRLVPVAAVLVALGGITAVVLLGVPAHRDLYPRFPFLANFIYNAGVGPVLLPDVLIRPLRPLWPSWVWEVVEGILLAGNALWAFVALSARRMARAREGRPDRELLWFAGLFVLGSLTATTLVDRLATFDRYYLPELLGLTLLLAVVLSHRWEAGEARDSSPRTPASRRLVFRFAITLLPIAYFTAAGLHDYFRWNDARWALFREATGRGVSPANIQGGYEVNGWAGYDAFLAKAPPPACIGPCGCDIGWYCLDDSYRIGMNVYGNYEVVDSQRPAYWLANGPPVYLSRRRTP